MKKRNRLFRGLVFYTLSFLILITPNVIWFYINRDTYFETGVTRLTLGAIISLVFILCLLRGAFKEVDKRFATLISMLVILAIVYFFDSIIHDLFWILSCGIVGYVMYLALSAIGKRDLEYYHTYRNEKARIEARNEAQDIDLRGV